MSKWYPAAIEALKTIDNARCFLYEVAKFNPKAIVDAAGRLRQKADEAEIDGPDAEVLQILRNGNEPRKLNAIKQYRNITGATLLESKAHIESMQARYGL